MNAHPITLSDKDSVRGKIDLVVDGYDALGLVAGMSGGPGIVSVPNLIYALRDGGYGVLGGLGMTPSGLELYSNEAMMFSVFCHDMAMPLTLKEQQSMLDSIPYPAVRDYFTDFANVWTFPSGDWVNTCSNWPSSDSIPVLKEPINSDIPTLIINNQFDPLATRPQEAAKGLANSQFVEIANTFGHVAIYTGNDCVYKVSNAFMLDPMVKTDAACAEEAQLPEFLRANVITDAGAIKIGDEIKDELGLAERKSYTLVLKAEEKVTIFMEAQDDGFSIDSFLWLIDSDGKAITSNDEITYTDDQTFNSVLKNVTVTTDRTLTVEAATYGDGGSGKFILRVVAS